KQPVALLAVEVVVDEARLRFKILCRRPGGDRLRRRGDDRLLPRLRRLLGVPAAPRHRVWGFLALHPPQPGEGFLKHFLAVALAAEFQGHTPAARRDAEHVLVLVDAGDRPAHEREDLVLLVEAAAVDVGLLQDLRDYDLAQTDVLEPTADDGAQAGV